MKVAYEVEDKLDFMCEIKLLRERRHKIKFDAAIVKDHDEEWYTGKLGVLADLETLFTSQPTAKVHTSLPSVRTLYALLQASDLLVADWHAAVGRLVLLVLLNAKKRASRSRSWSKTHCS